MINKHINILIKRYKMTKPLLMSFDFDHTVIDKNSDIVIRELLPNEYTETIKKLYKSCDGWTMLMKNIFELLHSNKITKDEINDTINSIPAVQGFEEILKNLNSNNCEVIIISDSNSVFIENWLKYRQLDHTVNKIFTNPAWFDDKNLLNIKPYHEQNWCTLSEKNLCKGYILENYIKERTENGVSFEKIAYAGDGKNDLCPILKLSDKDIAFPRQDYPIIKLLNDPDTKNNVKAQVIPWKTGTDIWNALVNKINL
ncbi:pyridoxal phosphate phosphatase PHOSPHO2-like [Microplitis mediator]|uniref:pyridoxal phosphate phosphatase PHOSPHO2-like n=1 Tax=Microplitis mediator TaxID=375433 RepID=UPI002554DFB0|nr:pyridoxal phosphate phosphatase PHOSPHO2-like [Microplitis mediator]